MLKKGWFFLAVIMCTLLWANVGYAKMYEMEAKPIKDFQLSTIDGKEIRLSQLKGKPIILNFFTTWCPSCKEEMPALRKFYQNHSSDVHFFAVNYTAYEVGKIDKIKEYVKENNMNFPVLLDESGEVGKLYEVLTLPTTFFLDSQGNIVKKHIGPLSYEEIEQIISGINT